MSNAKTHEFSFMAIRTCKPISKSKWFMWKMIEPSETTQSDNKKDKTAIAFLYQSLPEEQLLQITKHKIAKAIWDALKTRHMGEQRVQQARLQTLQTHFEVEINSDTITLQTIDVENRHIAPNCPLKTKKHEQSNLVEEDLEPTLLMAILEDLDQGKQVKEVEDQKISLHEEDVGYKETRMIVYGTSRKWSK
ncbi:hypothetical protein Tco_0756754 [Tanacetum coccineum]